MMPETHLIHTNPSKMQLCTEVNMGLESIPCHFMR